MINKFENDFNLFREDYIKLSKEPFQFLSCFLSYYNHLKYNKEIKIPILFDASCSGVQHLASLANDLTVAKMVNVVSDENCKNDFYKIAAEYVQNYIFNKNFY